MKLIVFLLVLIKISGLPSGAENKVIRDGICRELNSYYISKGSCDSYVECIAHHATHKTCPDGLQLIPNVVWPKYPCAYPLDAKCDPGDALLKVPEPECKNHYGLTASPLASRSDCGKYRMCVDGKAYEMECSIGLAFNPEIGLCDWPELVMACDAEAFLGFKCPPGTYDDHGKAYVINFGIPGRCYYYFTCIGGIARLQMCDDGFAFDHALNRCVDATRVYCKET